jgi:hypothetical protein
VFICLLLVAIEPLLGAVRSPDTSVEGKGWSSRNPLPEDWDSGRYISIDEIKPGMEAYCLTDYGDAGIEKFRMVVVDVVRNIDPGRDAILVKGLDERFIHTGPVMGCSGSPLYVNNRLAGALAMAWTFSKDPLYGVTPIAEMLMVGRAAKTKPLKQVSQRTGLAIDLSKPIDFARIYKQVTTPSETTHNKMTTVTYLPCPLLISGLSAEASEQVRGLFEPLGFMAVSGGGGSGAKTTTAQLIPGAALAVPLLAGDIEASALGTVTEVRDGKVYGFGHGYSGYGSVDLPMATAEIYTVISSLARSTKIGSPREIVGAITTDEAAGVFGRIGAKPTMIPMTIRVNHCNDTKPRVYKCLSASNKSLTPILIETAVAGAAYQIGSLPLDHTIEYTVSINTKTGESVRFHNTSTTVALNELMAANVSTLALLMNNPYKEAEIQSVEVDLKVTPKNTISHIWSVDISDPKVEAGHEVNIEVIVESIRAQKTKYHLTLKVPDDLSPGTYSLMISGQNEYERFLRKAVPYRFVADNYSSLIQILNDILNIERGKLYCLLLLPPGGVSVERAELPDLPATRALVLQSPKRVLKVQPYPHWIEKTVDTGTIIIDKEILNIVVEK